MQKMSFRGFEVYYIDINHNFKLGFNFDAQIFIPKNLNENPELIYACNLTKDYTDKCNSVEELIALFKKVGKEKYGSIDPMMMHLCLERGNPLVIPFIPRLKEFRPNFLGRDCLLNSFDLKGEDRCFQNEIYLYNNLASQHKAIIKAAINCLEQEGINVSEKVILCGYSEGAKFASHFALLHPEIIKAVVAGGTGGVMSMPISSYRGYEFVYPTGISGLQNFDFLTFKEISFFYYMGKCDKSDSAIPNFKDYHYLDSDGNSKVLQDECGNSTPYIDEDGNQKFLLDKNGNYTAKFNLFSDDEVNAINKALGTKIQDRFKKQETIYKSLGLNAVFKLYDGNHRTVFNEKDKLFADVDDFITNCHKNNTFVLK